MQSSAFDFTGNSVGGSSNIFLSLIHGKGFAFGTISLIANRKKYSYISGAFIQLQTYNYQKKYHFTRTYCICSNATKSQKLLNLLTIY